MADCPPHHDRGGLESVSRRVLGVFPDAEHRRWLRRTAHPPGLTAQTAARFTRDHPGGGRILDPGLGIQDQPHGVGTGELQVQGCRGSPHALRSPRRDRARGAPGSGQGGEPRRVVAQLRRRTAGLVPDVHRPRRCRFADPRVRSAVRARPVADRGVRPRGRHPRQLGRMRPPTSTAGSRCASSAKRSWLPSTRRSSMPYSTSPPCAVRTVNGT